MNINFKVAVEIQAFNIWGIYPLSRSLLGFLIRPSCSRCALDNVHAYVLQDKWRPEILSHHDLCGFLAERRYCWATSSRKSAGGKVQAKQRQTLTVNIPRICFRLSMHTWTHVDAQTLHLYTMCTLHCGLLRCCESIYYRAVVFRNILEPRCRVCSHSVTRALVRSGTDVGWWSLVHRWCSNLSRLSPRFSQLEKPLSLSLSLQEAIPFAS